MAYSEEERRKTRAGTGKATAMPASTTQRLVRTRGIEAPYNKDQVASMVLHPVISIVSRVLFDAEVPLTVKYAMNTHHFLVLYIDRGPGR